MYKEGKKIQGAVYPSKINTIGLLYYKDGEFYIARYSNFDKREVEDIKINSLEEAYSILAKQSLHSI
ncbi:MAG: hypothetical protein ACOCRX_08880 [Candidatus Woesearchaeota archaeon]